MLGLKIDYRNYDMFLDLLTILGEAEPAAGKSGLNGTMIVVFTDSEGTRVLSYWQPKDFHERFRWVEGEAVLDRLTEVEPINLETLDEHIKIRRQ